MKYSMQLGMNFVYQTAITVFSLRYQLAWSCAHVQMSPSEGKSPSSRVIWMV